MKSLVRFTLRQQVLFNLAFALTILVGLIALGEITIELGTAGGLLLTGLVIGFLRSIWPVFGRVPSASRWVLMELGLLPGTGVEVLRVAPLGDPIQILVRGCRLSIRRADAARLLVQLDSATPVTATGCEGCAA